MLRILKKVKQPVFHPVQKAEREISREVKLVYAERLDTIKEFEREALELAEKFNTVLQSINLREAALWRKIADRYDLPTDVERYALDEADDVIGFYK